MCHDFLSYGENIDTYFFGDTLGVYLVLGEV